MRNPFDTGTYLVKTPLQQGGDLRRILINAATMFGIGRIKPGPGTWGSLATLPVVFLFNQFGPVIYMGLTLAIVIFAILSAQAYEDQVQGHDASEIVIDEMAGMLVTMTWLPQTWQAFVIGFVLFRLLDIFKPFPINLFDRKVGGGLGVVADDLVAGLIGSFILQVMLYHTNWLGEQWQNF